MQCLRFDLLAFDLAIGVVEVEYYAALLQLLYKQLVAFFGADVWG